MLKLFDTMARKKVGFKPLKGRNVGLYTCGPTVYDFAHIGNFRAYIFYDLIKRYLQYSGYKVKHVMNITDVDDKTIRNSRKEEMSLSEFTKKYTDAFFEDVNILRIKKADIYPKATEHINEMTGLVIMLLKKGYAYKGEDNSIYFDISKFKDYGKLSHLKINELKAGSRISQDEYSKEEAQDFALWKAWGIDDGDVFWDAKIGSDVIRGRPGWHLECSVMSMKYLGKTIDMHSGGVDLIFPHHENEIAQSEAATGKTFVNYWVHCEHLLVDGRKMSKSLGNFYTLRDIITKGHSPIAFRYLCLSTHYRSQLNFTFQSLDDAKRTVDTFNDFVFRLKEEMKSPKAKKQNKKISQAVNLAKQKFEKHMDDDLNTPQALATVFGLMNIVNKEIDAAKTDRKSMKLVYDFLMKINEIFDIIELKEKKLSDEEKELIELREKYRKEKNFAEADKIRTKLKEMGIILEDTPQGVRWKKVK